MIKPRIITQYPNDGDFVMIRSVTGTPEWHIMPVEATKKNSNIEIRECTYDNIDEIPIIKQ